MPKECRPSPAQGVLTGKALPGQKPQALGRVVEREPALTTSHERQS